MGASTVRFERRGSVGLIVMDDGKVNAEGVRFVEDFSRALDEAEGESVGAVVLTGRPGVLSAGLDLKALPALSDADRTTFATVFCAAMVRAFAFPKPTVCLATGHALAGGAVLLQCADVRLASRGPFKIGLVEIAVGIAFPAPILHICRARLPAGAHGPAILHGRTFDPEGARAIGLVDEVVDPAVALDRALAIAGELAALPSEAYARTKEDLRGRDARRSMEDLDAERFAADIVVAAERRGR
ncbi:MAG: enoyl-CoA hydratase/isomerase family protein [Myxococcales bacterium]|nr:enoyl-CoA hydratase/isomerase family protein [Myxococcales bacterium]